MSRFLSGGHPLNSGLPCSRVTWSESAPMLTDKNIRNDNSTPRLFSCIFWAQSFEYRSPRLKEFCYFFSLKKDLTEVTGFFSTSRNFVKSILQVYKNSNLTWKCSTRRYCMINIIHPSVDLSCWLNKNSYTLEM